MAEKIKSNRLQAIATKSNDHKWSDEQLLAEMQDIDLITSSNIIRLFKDENTIPFICRYRRELIGDLSPDQMRDMKMTFNHIQNIRARAQTILNDLEKRNLLTKEIDDDIMSAKSLDELDFLVRITLKHFLLDSHLTLIHTCLVFTIQK